METKNKLVWVTQARNMPDYCLELTFNNGNKRVFDCKPLINQYALFSPLKDSQLFKDFKLDGWTVTWLNGKIDIAPEHLYEQSRPA